MSWDEIYGEISHFSTFLILLLSSMIIFHSPIEGVLGVKMMQNNKNVLDYYSGEKRMLIKITMLSPTKFLGHAGHLSNVLGSTGYFLVFP